MKMHGCAIGFEHFGHGHHGHGRHVHGQHGHGHKHHGHGHGHHGFGPFGLGARGFGHRGHHWPRGLGHPGLSRGPCGPHPFHFFGFQGCGLRGFEMHGGGPHGFEKHGHRGGFAPCGRDKKSQNFDRFVDGHGFEWRLYIDVSATEKDRPDREDEDNARNEATETSDSECEHTRRCWGKHGGGRKFGMRHGRKCLMERKGKAPKGCRCENATRVNKTTCQEAGPSTAAMEQEQETPSAPAGETHVVEKQPENGQEGPANA